MSVIEVAQAKSIGSMMSNIANILALMPESMQCLAFDNGGKDLIESIFLKTSTPVTSTKSKPKKKKIDPKKPKRPKSAYLFFCGVYREDVKKNLDEIVNASRAAGEDVKIPIGGVLKELSKIWKDLKKNRKAELLTFQKMADEDKIRYKKEMEDYTSGGCPPELSDEEYKKYSDEYDEAREKFRIKAPHNALKCFSVSCLECDKIDEIAFAKRKARVKIEESAVDRST